MTNVTRYDIATSNVDPLDGSETMIINGAKNGLYVNFSDYSLLLARLERHEAANERRGKECLCFWCCEIFPMRRDGTREEQADDLTAHAMTCVENPWHKANERANRLAARLERMQKALNGVNGAFLEVAAGFARGTYLMNIEGCRTIGDARYRFGVHETFHRNTAFSLKKKLDELKTEALEEKP